MFSPSFLVEFRKAVACLHRCLSKQSDHIPVWWESLWLSQLSLYLLLQAQDEDLCLLGMVKWLLTGALVLEQNWLPWNMFSEQKEKERMWESDPKGKKVGVSFLGFFFFFFLDTVWLKITTKNLSARLPELIIDSEMIKCIKFDKTAREQTPRKLYCGETISL